MPSSFSTNLGIEKPATGELSGTWGNVTNFNFDIFDRIVGFKSVTLSNTSSTLTVRATSPSSGSSNVQDGMFRAIKFVDGGDIGGTVTLTISPNTSANLFFFQNSLSGSRDITVTQGSGANVTVTNGQTSIVYCDGAGSGAAVVSISDNLSMSNAKITGGSLSGITSLVVDDLTINGQDISTTASNKNITVTPHGTGVFEVKGNTNEGTIQLNCENNSHGVKIKAPPHSAGQSYTLTLPQSITNNYYLKTDGSGNLSFAEVATETRPTVADVSQTIAPATATTINITGTNFVTVPIVEFIKTDGSITRPNSVSFTSATSLSVNVTLASGNYHVRIENPDGNAGRSTNDIITASTAPTWSTSAGSLGSVAAGDSVSLDVDASSDSTVAFSETTSVLTSNSDTPASTMNLTLNSSTGAITGTAPSPSSETTYNFTLRATDAESQTADRAFSITISVGMNNSGCFSH